ncbi:MAG TPA: hypothetical protein VKM55_00625 [Candidatus Lokiarchaeia archaeon]|nr:hypothetical protein [Candidatus Lokiarchaeia archaeon]
MTLIENKHASLERVLQHRLKSDKDAFLACLRHRNLESRKEALGKTRVDNDLAGESGLFTITSRGIKPNNHVGIIKIKDITITILPKIFPENSGTENTRALLFMLQASGGIAAIKHVSLAGMDTTRGLLEIIAFLFAINLRAEIQRGILSDYVTIEENVPYLKGKLLVAQNAVVNMANKGRFYCEHDEFSIDTPLNRTILYAVHILRLAIDYGKTRRVLEHIIQAFDGVDVHRPPSQGELDRVVFSRDATRFKPYFEVAKSIIRNSSPTLQGGDLDFFSFMFNMPLLFERFITNVFLIKANTIFHGNSAKVTPKDSQYHLLLESDGQKSHRLEPDLIVTTESRLYIIDLKYKVIEDEEGNKGCIARADAYQMYAYAHRYYDEWSVAKDNVVVLVIYPKHIENESEKKGVFRSYSIQGIQGVLIYLATVDLKVALEGVTGDRDFIDNISTQLAEIIKNVSP